MAYYRKNKRRFDPRYFMNERMEQIDEMIPGDGGFPRRFSDDDEEWPQKEKEKTPGDMARELWNARQNSGPEALEDYERSVEDQLANLAWAEAEQEEIDDRNRKFNQGGLEENNLEEACGDAVPESFFVKSHKLGTTLTAGDPNAAADFVKHLISLGHKEEDLEMSDEVWAALGMSPPDAELEES